MLRSPCKVGIAASLLLLQACSTPRGGEIGPRFWIQAARGQLELFNRARPISEALKDPRLDPRYRAALEEIPRIKAFGEEMGLKATSSYQDFVDLKRDSVVHVVSGCESLRFEALWWKFPVVGGFTYLGWFDREQAIAMKERLQSEGYDADVRGAAAYSTLGWFRDPVTSTQIGRPGSFDLIETLLHESVHATVHFESQSTFNESLAQFVAEKLTPIYLGRFREKEAMARYEEELAGEKARGKLIRSAYEELSALYASGASEDRKRLEKKRIYERLRTELAWPESRELNNATLIQFATYGSGTRGFESLWSGCKGSLAAFLGVLKASERELASASNDSLDSMLAGLASRCQP